MKTLLTRRTADVALTAFASILLSACGEPVSPGAEHPPRDSQISEWSGPSNRWSVGDGSNPLVGAKFFIDPESKAMLEVGRLRQADPQAASALDKIARVPQALWLGPDSSGSTIRHFVQRAANDEALPVVVLRNLPDYGGCMPPPDAPSAAEAYRAWIRDMRAGIGDHAVAIVLEPFALVETPKLSETVREERLSLLREAIAVLRQGPGVVVFVGAGHPGWLEPGATAELLIDAGVENAHGFALNTAHYRTTEESLEYGAAISRLVGNKHFVVDTSRNGAGPYLEAKHESETWCNPPGRKLGVLPTTDTGHALCDGFLWLSRPGESDGQCWGGPRAGVFWPELALRYVE